MMRQVETASLALALFVAGALFWAVAEVFFSLLAALFCAASELVSKWKGQG